MSFYFGDCFYTQLPLSIQEFEKLLKSAVATSRLSQSKMESLVKLAIKTMEVSTLQIEDILITSLIKLFSPWPLERHKDGVSPISDP